MKFKRLFLIFLAASFLGGCAPNISPNNYNVADIGAANNVVRGVIVTARPVQVSGHNNGVGGLTGAVAGGIAGSTIGGGGTANALGAVGGAIAGGLLGNAVQKGVSKQTGIEYIVKTSKGRLLSVVQGTQSALSVGQHVLVILGNPAKIIPDTE